jgi:hypothetical protein
MKPVVPRVQDAVTSTVLAVAAVVSCLAAGYLFASVAAPQLRAAMLPWLAGRALGLAGYVALAAVTALGTWIRHPWRFRWPALHPEVQVRLHATLGSASVVLVAAHLSALALDHYAGVGWSGAFVPGLAHYRTVPVALGVIAFYLLVLVVATAGLAGRIGGRSWLTVHRVAVPVFGCVWLHGVLSGTDTAALRAMYVLTGVLVVALAATRHLAPETRPGNRLDARL